MKVEGGVGTDDVEAEIRASRQCRRGTRSHSHHRLGGGGSHNGFGSSSSSGGVPRTVGAGLCTDQFFDSTVSADGGYGGNHHHHRHTHHDNHTHHHHQRQFQHQQRVPAEWTDIDNGIGNNGGGGPTNGGNGERSSVGGRGWDSGNTRSQGHKRERPELRGGGADGGWGASLRGFRGGGGGRGNGHSSGNDSHNGGDMDCGGSAFMGVSGTASQTSSPPPSIMSSDDVSVSSYGHPVTVLPGSPNNMRFDGRPPPSLAKIRLEAVRSPVVRRNGGGGGRSRGERGAGGPVFTSPDASKHVQELCSPRSAFTPRSASSVSSLASSRGRR